MRAIHKKFINFVGEFPKKLLQNRMQWCNIILMLALLLNEC